MCTAAQHTGIHNAPAAVRLRATALQSPAPKLTVCIIAVVSGVYTDVLLLDYCVMTDVSTLSCATFVHNRVVCSVWTVWSLCFVHANTKLVIAIVGLGVMLYQYLLSVHATDILLGRILYLR